MARTAVKKTETKQPRTRTARDRERGAFKWIEEEKGVRWTSALIPTGDWITASVRRTFSPSGVTKRHDYYAYRNGRILGMRRTPEEAMRLAESGREDRREDVVKTYVDEHRGEVPPFLDLSEEHQKIVLAQYPFAAPSDSKVTTWADKMRSGGKEGQRALSKPNVRAYLRQVERRSAERAANARPLRQPKEGAAPRPPRETLRGLLVRAREGNPKAAGTAAHGRWEALFAACASGKSAEKYVEDGGNPETLRNAVAKGYVRLEAEK